MEIVLAVCVLLSKGLEKNFNVPLVKENPSGTARTLNSIFEEEPHVKVKMRHYSNQPEHVIKIFC